MTIVRVGTTKKYSEGWEAAFSKRGKKTAAAPKKAQKKAVKKSPKSATKPAAKKKPAKKK